MSGKKQVWYIEGSAAAALAAPLRERYDLHAVTHNKQPEPRLAHSSDTAGALVVWLEDMKLSGELLHPRSYENANNCRVIGVFSVDGSSSAQPPHAQNP